MDKNELYYSSLHATLIVKNFVKGDKNCNYEKYLLELINESQYFWEKFNHIPFVKPKKEDAGESDCYSGNYGLDFKLVLSQTNMQAKRELTSQIYLLAEGIRATSTPRRPNESMTVSKLHVALRENSLEDLIRIRGEKHEYGSLEFDIQAYLETLETNKNLFLFVPLRFYFKEEVNFNDAILEIANVVPKDYITSLHYRNKFIDDKDLYLALIYNETLLILKATDGNFILKDTVDMNKSSTYSNLKRDYLY